MLQKNGKGINPPEKWGDHLYGQPRVPFFDTVLFLTPEVMKLVVNLRVPEEHELSGVDEHTHGELYHSPAKAYKPQEKAGRGSRCMARFASFCQGMLGL